MLIECLLCVRLNTLQKVSHFIFTTALSGGCIFILILETREQRPGEVRQAAQGNQDTKNNQRGDANGLTSETSLLTRLHLWGSFLRSCPPDPTKTLGHCHMVTTTLALQFRNQDLFSPLPYCYRVKEIICAGF